MRRTCSGVPCPRCARETCGGRGRDAREQRKTVFRASRHLHLRDLGRNGAKILIGSSPPWRARTVFARVLKVPRTVSDFQTSRRSLFTRLETPGDAEVCAATSALASARAPRAHNRARADERARGPSASLGSLGSLALTVSKKEIAERDEDVPRRAERLLLGAARARPRETRTRGGEDAFELLGIHALVTEIAIPNSRYVTIGRRRRVRRSSIPRNASSAALRASRSRFKRSPATTTRRASAEESNASLFSSSEDGKTTLTLFRGSCGLRSKPELAKRAAALSAAPSQCAAGRPRGVSHRRAESARRHAAAASLGSPGPRAGRGAAFPAASSHPPRHPLRRFPRRAATTRRARDAPRTRAAPPRRRRFEPFPTRRERATRRNAVEAVAGRGVFRSRSNAGTIRSGSGPTTPRTRARLSRRKDARAAARRRRRLARRVARRLGSSWGRSFEARAFYWIFDRLTMWSSRRGAYLADPRGRATTYPELVGSLSPRSARRTRAPGTAAAASPRAPPNPPGAPCTSAPTAPPPRARRALAQGGVRLGARAPRGERAAFFRHHRADEHRLFSSSVRGRHEHTPRRHRVLCRERPCAPPDRLDAFAIRRRARARAARQRRVAYRHRLFAHQEVALASALNSSRAAACLRAHCSRSSASRLATASAETRRHSRNAAERAASARAARYASAISRRAARSRSPARASAIAAARFEARLARRHAPNANAPVLERRDRRARTPANASAARTRRSARASRARRREGVAGGFRVRLSRPRRRRCRALRNATRSNARRRIRPRARSGRARVAHRRHARVAMETRVQSGPRRARLLLGGFRSAARSRARARQRRAGSARLANDALGARLGVAHQLSGGVPRARELIALPRVQRGSVPRVQRAQTRLVRCADVRQLRLRASRLVPPRARLASAAASSTGARASTPSRRRRPSAARPRRRRRRPRLRRRASARTTRAPRPGRDDPSSISPSSPELSPRVSSTSRTASAKRARGVERARVARNRRSAASSRVVSLPERAASISAGSTPPGPHSSAVPFMGGNETRVVAKKKRSDVRQSEHACPF